MARFLLEIGTEDLPPASIPSVLAQWKEVAGKLLKISRLEHGEIRTAGTPRRLVLDISDLALRQPDAVKLARGPAAKVAYDAAGNPTPAAIGFARSQGVPVEALKVEERDGGRYVVAEVRERGQRTSVLLGTLLLNFIVELSFPKPMRYLEHGFRFGRPIRWVVALLDRTLIKFPPDRNLDWLPVGRRTFGHRFLAPRSFVVSEAGKYAAIVRRAHVMLDADERRARIVTRARAMAITAKGRPVLDQALLEELVWSTEHPTPLLGRIDPTLAASVPAPVLLTTLQHHQKCFGVKGADGRLLPAFIAVRDGGTSHLASVRTGHEWVVRARLADARFFLEDDRRGTFAAWAKALAQVTYVERLGSVADHARHLVRVATWLAEAVGADAQTATAVARAAEICKSDLVTAMVKEFPELQGTMGGIYAREAGEPEAVARAIEEHYLPKGAGDAAPASLPGALLAAADRAALLAGAFLVGLEPTGSQDPYGLRRAASSILAILRAHHVSISLRGLLSEAAATYDHDAAARARAVAAAVEFVLQRLRTWLIDQDIAYDEADAVLATSDDVTDLVARARALHAVRLRPVMARLATGYTRAMRILLQAQVAGIRDSTSITKLPPFDELLLTEPTEIELHTAMLNVDAAVKKAVEGRQYSEALQALARLADPIDAFFDDVLVMAPDEKLRNNRLGLLFGVTSVFLRVADFSKLVG